MNRLITNWQTTSAGLLMILGSAVHLIFAIKAGNATEGVWTASLGTIVGGVGLMFAGDANKSATKEDLQQVSQSTAVAIKTGDTTMLTNPTQPTEPPKP